MEKQTGVYRCQLASWILTERLVTDDLDRELAGEIVRPGWGWAAINAEPNGSNGRNAVTGVSGLGGLNGQHEALAQMGKRSLNFIGDPLTGNWPLFRVGCAQVTGHKKQPNKGTI